MYNCLNVKTLYTITLVLELMHCSEMVAFQLRQVTVRVLQSLRSSKVETLKY